MENVTNLIDEYTQSYDEDKGVSECFGHLIISFSSMFGTHTYKIKGDSVSSYYNGYSNQTIKEKIYSISEYYSGPKSSIIVESDSTGKYIQTHGLGLCGRIYRGLSAYGLFAFHGELYFNFRRECARMYQEGNAKWDCKQRTAEILPIYGSNFFSFQDKLHFKKGSSLWRISNTDTSRIGSFYRSRWVSKNIEEYNGNLYYTCSDSVYGYELWEYDGVNPPSMVSDINAGVASSFPCEFEEYNGSLFFQADDGTHGKELWKYDGINPPLLVKDMREGSEDANPSYLESHNGKLYFSLKTGADELWSYEENAVEASELSGCNTLTLPDGTVAYKSGIYRDRNTGEYFHVTIHNTITHEHVYSCGDFISPFGKVYSKDGIYSDTVSNESGCDSIYYFHVHIEQDTAITIVVDDSYNTYMDTWLYDHSQSNTNRLFYDTLKSPGGCNYAFTVIDYSYPAMNYKACDSVVLLNGKVVCESGKYYETGERLIDSIADSLFIYNVEIFGDSKTEIDTLVCGAYTSPNGNEYRESGNYTDSLTSINGCDSLIYVNLQIGQNEEKEIIINKDSWVAPWDKIFSGDGVYYDTVVAPNGCETYYKILLQKATGIAGDFSEFIVYPNPVDKTINISSGNSQIGLIEVFSSNGIQVLSKGFKNTKRISLNVDFLHAGTYVMNIHVGNRIVKTVLAVK